MTRALCSLAFAAGFGLAWWLATRNAAQPVEPVQPVNEDERWQKRIDSLEGFITEEKAIDRMKRK